MKSKYIFEKQKSSMPISRNSNDMYKSTNCNQEIKFADELNQSSDDIKRFKVHIKKRKGIDRANDSKSRNEDISASDLSKLRMIASYTPDLKGRKYSAQAKLRIESSFSTQNEFLQKVKQSAIKDIFKQRYNLRKNNPINALSKQKMKEISRELNKISKILI